MTDDAPKTPRYQVFQELTADLQIARGSVHAPKMAALLLRYATDRDLVGVTADATRALYYELASRSLVAVRFDKHGIHHGNRELIQRELDDPGAWVAAHGTDLTWVHPRWRGE